MGKFRESQKGDITPRTVMILVEWKSIEDFHSFTNDPALTDFHPRRENSTTNYIWHLFDKLEDLRPIFKM